jgi:hypothetical protein
MSPFEFVDVLVGGPETRRRPLEVLVRNAQLPTVYQNQQPVVFGPAADAPSWRR